MNLEWLKTFKRVVETNSFTRAADQLYMSQPAVSQQLRRLEGFFACRLFERTGRDLKLTEAGRRVLDLAHQIEEEIDRARQDLRRIALANRQTITVGGGPTPLVHLLAPAIRAFGESHPDIVVSPVSGTTEAVTAGLVAGDVDVGLLQDTFVLDPSLEISATFIDRIVAVCSPQHHLAGRRICPADLAEERVAVIRYGTESRRLLDEWFGQRGVFLSNCVELATFTDVRVSAIANLAVGFLSKYSVDEDIEAGRLQIVDVEGFNLTRPLFVVNRTGVTGPVKEFIEQIALLILGDH